MKCLFLTAITIGRRHFAEGLNSQPSRRNLSSRSATTSPIEMTTTMLAAIQMTSTNHKQSNLDKTIRLVDFAAANGAVFIALPECSSFIGGGTDSESQENGQHLDAIAASERLDGPYALALCELASRLNVWLSVGGFPEKIDHVNESGTVDKRQSLKVYNTNFMISPVGLITSVYRKIHLFDSPMAGLIESKNTAAGDALVIADCGFARVGLTTCYDLRFPELYGALCRPLDNSDDAQQDSKSAMCGLGAEIVLVPSAFTVTTGIAHWETLLRARAIENQCYIVAAAQIGTCYYYLDFLHI
jgi:deaminated glutathione amidase